MDFSWDVSKQTLSSEEEEPEDGGENSNPYRKHIVYQSCLQDLISMVSEYTCVDLWQDPQHCKDGG